MKAWRNNLKQFFKDSYYLKEISYAVKRNSIKNIIKFFKIKEKKTQNLLRSVVLSVIHPFAGVFLGDENLLSQSSTLKPIKTMLKSQAANKLNLQVAVAQFLIEIVHELILWREVYLIHSMCLYSRYVVDTHTL